MVAKEDAFDALGIGLHVAREALEEHKPRWVGTRFVQREARLNGAASER